jgi:hypothetical protein
MAADCYCIKGMKPMSALGQKQTSAHVRASPGAVGAKALGLRLDNF